MVAILKWCSFEQGRYVAAWSDGSVWRSERVGDRRRDGDGNVTRRLAGLQLAGMLLGRRVCSWSRCVTELVAAVDRGRRICV